MIAPTLAPMPVPWLTLDIETSSCRPECAEAAMRRDWQPDERWKDETIAKRYREALAKQKERLALLPDAPIVSVAVATPGELVCFHAMRAEPMRLLGQAPVHGFADEASLLTALREFLNSRGGPDTILAGHNVAGFDLPRLRLAFLRYGLQLPAVLADEQPTFDTLKVFARRFYGDGAAFLGLGEVCELVGIPNHKGVCNGADVPALVAAGRVDELVTYNFVDAVLQAELFLRLSGRSTQLK